MTLAIRITFGAVGFLLGAGVGLLLRLFGALCLGFQRGMQAVGVRP